MVVAMELSFYELAQSLLEFLFGILGDQKLETMISFIFQILEIRVSRIQKTETTKDSVSLIVRIPEIWVSRIEKIKEIRSSVF